jgi:hypothetical protein
MASPPKHSSEPQGEWDNLRALCAWPLRHSPQGDEMTASREWPDPNGTDLSLFPNYSVNFVVNYSGANYPVNLVVNHSESTALEGIDSVHDKVYEVVKSK